MDQATDRARPRPGPDPPTQHLGLPQIQGPASASELAVRLSRVAQAALETQDRALGLSMDLGAIQAELATLRVAAIELAMAEPGPFTTLAQAQDDGGEHSEHRAPTGARPRPVATVVGQDPWLFAAVIL